MAGPWSKYQQQPAIDQAQPKQAGPWAKYQAVEPAADAANDVPDEQGGIQALDFGKELTGGALAGTGAVVSGFGDLLTTAGRAIERGARAVLPDGAVDALRDIPAPSGLLFRPAGQQLDSAGKGIQATKTEAAKLALEASTPQGDVLDPSSWSMGDDPSLVGYGLHGANLIGQFVPQAAALAIPGGQARMAGMAGIGGLQAGGAAGNEVGQRLAALPDAELQQASELYRELRAGGMGEADARAHVSATARAAAFQGAAPVGAVGGAMTNYALGPLQRQIGGGVGRRLAGGLALDAPAEGAQEVSEAVAARAATNRAIGERRDLTEDTFGDAVLGAMGGAGHATLGAALGRPQPQARPADPAAEADATFDDTPQTAALPAPGLQGLPAPEQTFYADSQGNMQGTGPVRNVDGEMQPDQQGRQWINPRNRADRPVGGEGMEREVARGEPAPLVGQFQHGSRQQVADTGAQQGLTLEGEVQQMALPAPEAIVVDGQGNAQRGATAPQVFERAPSGGRGMDQQAPTAGRRNDDFEYITRASGEPFQAHGAAKASKVFREAKKAGRNPTVAKVDGGFAVRVPADPKRYQMRPIDQAAHQAATSPSNDLPAPTPAQIEAGNYKKGRIRVQGLDISIENPRGSERSGTGPDGTPWRRTMSDHYGYIKRTTGADGEQVDVYAGPQPDSGQVFVVDQVNQQDGSFDEHKVMLGYPDQESAVTAYRSNFDKGWQVGPVTAMPVDRFKTWLKTGDLSAPLAQTEAPATRPAPPTTSGRKTPRGQRRSVNRDRDSVVQAAIRLGGITTQWKQDTTGDTKGNKNIPGVGALWSDNTGTSIDDMASLLDQHGYVPAGEMDRDGGVNWLQEALRDELAGRKTHYAPDSVRQLEQYELEMLERINEQLAAQREQLEAEYARIEAEHGAEAAAHARSQDAAFDEDALRYEEFISDEPERTETFIDGNPLDEDAAVRRDDEVRAADAAEAGSAGQDRGASFRLEQQTEAGLKEQAERNAAAEKARADQERDTEQKAQADRDREDFTLTGSDRISDVAAARGQNDMFGAQTAARAEPASVASQLASMQLDDLSALIDDVATEIAAPQTSKPKAQRSTKAKTATGKKTARKVATKAELTDTSDTAAVSRTAGEIAKSLGVNMSSAGMNALEGLTQLFGGPGRLNSGLSFDEETYAKAKPHFAAAMADIQAAGKNLRDFIRALVGQFGDGVKPYILRYAQDLKQEQDSERTDSGLEPDSAADAEQGAGADLRNDQPGEGGRGAGSVGGESRGRGTDAAPGVPGNRAAAGGKRGDQSLDGEESGLEAGATGSVDGGRGRPSSTGGLHAGRTTDGAADSATARAVTTVPKAAVKASSKPGTLAEIKAQMPFLTDGQAEDVVFAEQRLMKPDGYGVLYTNGTGTGKTFTGAGIAARSAARGKDNILVVAPKQPIVDAWTKAGAKFFGLDIKALADTEDNGGSGIVVTTYANLAANNSLALRDWDMVIADEAHYLSSAEDGKTTGALEALRALTKRQGYAQNLVRMREPDKVARLKELNNLIEAYRRDASESGGNGPHLDAAQHRKDQAEAAALTAELDALYQKESEAFEAADPASKPRAVFLSATPFAYEKNVQWAQEFLFDWGGDQDGRSYNSGGNYERFMMQHFGYRMRYNKLTEPDAKVDRGLMQRAFNSWLKSEGALSARALDSDFDYDRLFVTVESRIGRRVDDALKWLRDMTGTKDADGNELHASDAEREAFREVHDRIAKDSFNYHARMYFLEAIKAREALPHIRAHLAAGRKVLVMHDFKKGGAVNPFRQSFSDDAQRAAYARFTAEFRDVISAFGSLPSPIDQLSRAFPDALIYNGSVPAKRRLELQNQFNDDAPDAPRLMIAQGDAMREGVSIHDTTGKYPRVLVHLGMPTKPTAAIQQEGRIYRTGQASDAMFRYFTIGTSWERSAFASKIASRASAAENLAMGEQARGLKQAFIEAYENADLYEPGFNGEGLGGKAADRAAAAALTPWDMAKSFYFGTKTQGKGRSARGREGADYFATPEPVGLKMVEWADVRGGESVLEPSAGHGAIARWFPENAKARVIEQSAELASRVALHVDGEVVHGDFEAHNIVNKYDAIVMNPPYGLGGAVAIPHLAKAADHLRQGGRVVALIPTGPAADKKFENWLYGQDKNGKPLQPDLHLVGDVKMPSVTFERAGTSVATRVVIIEKAGADLAEQIQPTRQIDLSNVESIDELFDRMESIEMRARVKPVEDESLGEIAEQTAPSKSIEPKQTFAEKQAEENGKYLTDAPIIEHTTAKGKVLRGVIVTDMTLAEVKEKYYKFAFRKDGGVFLREELVQRPGSQQYRIGERAAGDALAEAVTQAIAESPELAGIKVVQSFDDLPLSARIRAKRDGVAPEELRGIYSSGATYVVAGNHASVADALYTAVHEEVGHRGIHGLLGDRLDATMERLYTSQAATTKGRQRIAQIRQAYAKVLEKLDARKQRLMIAEEMVALLIEDGERPTALQRVLSKMRELLRALVPQVPWTYTDILALGEQSRRWLRDNQAGTTDGERTLYALGGKRQHTSEAFSDLTAKQKEALNKIAPRTAKQQAIEWFRQQSDRALLKIRQGIVDRYAALRDLDEAVHGKDVLSTDIASSAWVLARMSSAASGALHAMLNNGRIYLDQQQKVIDIQDGEALGLGATLARLGSAAEIERFMGWIAGNRSAKLAAEGRENLFDAAEIDALRTLNRGTTEHGKARGALYNEVFAEFQQYRDDVLAIAEQTGVITPESRALWRDEFYVPFYRVMDEDAAAGPMASKGLTRQEAYKKLKGGNQNLNDLLQNTLLNFNHLLQASLKNQAAAQAIDNAEQLGIAQPVSEAARDKKASTFVLKAGVKQWYNIGDPLVFEALSSLSDAGLNNAAVRAMSFFKRLFTNMTTITPQFIIANLLRDSMSATATSPVSKNFVKNIAVGGSSWVDARKRARMLASGGAFSFGHIYSNDPDEVKAHLTRNLRSAKLIDGPKLVPQALKAGWDTWNSVANTAENANRAAIFEQNEQGRGKLAAAFEARDLMDFSLHGAWPAVRFLIRVVPFLNARLQGLDKLYRAGVKPSLLTAFGQGSTSDKQAAARFMTVVAALSLASMALLLVNNDDEEYRKLEEWEKDTYWNFFIGGMHWRIPKPFEVGAIATMAERLLQQAIDDKATGKLFAQRLGHTLTQTFSFSPVPHMFQPVLDVYSNVDAFTGRPIESTGMDRLSKGLRTRATTTAPARAASAVSRVFGDEFPLAVSPIQADHLIAGYLGQVGAWGAGMVDTMWRAANGESQPAKHWHEYQPIRRFYRDLDTPAAYTRYSTIFYEGLREAGKAYADVKELQELGRMDEAREVIREKRDVLGVRKQLNQVQRRLTAINSRMDAVRLGELDADAKRRELDRLLVIKNRLTEMAGKRLEDMRAKR